MAVQNKIENLHISEVEIASRISFGTTITRNTLEHFKNVGGCGTVGDYGQNLDFQENLYIGPQQ